MSNIFIKHTQRYSMYNYLTLSLYTFLLQAHLLVNIPHTLMSHINAYNPPHTINTIFTQTPAA